MKRVVLFGLTLVSLGCSFLPKSYNERDHKNLEFKPIWVESTLSEKNKEFRKVNRFSPLLDTRSNVLIVANSLEGITAYNLNYTGTEFSERDRTVKWTRNVTYGVEAPGVISKGILYFGALNGTFYAVRTSDGQIVWEFATGSEIVAEPLIANDRIYFVNGVNQVFALNLETGKQTWAYNRQDATAKMSVRGGAKPAISGQLLYVGFSDGSLVALNTATGTPQWEVQLNRNPRFKDLDSSALVVGDSIYVNSYDDHLYCLNKQTGQIIWKVKSGGVSSPILSGERLVFTTSDSQVLAVDRKSGAIVWSYKDVRGIATDPVLYKGNVVFGESQGSLLSLDGLSGLKTASFEPGRGVFSKPSVIEDDSSIVFISNEGNLYQLQVRPQAKNKLKFIR